MIVSMQVLDALFSHADPNVDLSHFGQRLLSENNYFVAFVCPLG